MAVQDILFTSVVFIVIGISLVLAFNVGGRITDRVANVTTVAANPVAVAAIHNTERAMNLSDYLSLGLFLALVLGIMITAWFLPQHPMFMWIYFFVIMFIVMISYILSQVWKEFATSAVMITTITSFPITNYILNNLGFFTTIIGLVGLLVMFGKPYIVRDFQ